MLRVLLSFVVFLSINPFLASDTIWRSFKGNNDPSPARIEVKQDKDSIFVNMELDGMNVQERDGFHLLSMPLADCTDESGKPRLPVVRKTISVPADCFLEIESEEHISLDGYNVYPAGRKVVRKSNGGTVFIDEEFTIDRDFYSSNNAYPENLVDIAFSGFLREQRVIQLEFHPIRFMPASGKLMCYSFIRARLSFDNIYNISASKVREIDSFLAPSATRKYNGNVIYPENLMSSNTADYIIIAPEPFYSSPKLKELASWRAQYTGLDVAMVGTDKLYHSFGPINKPDETIRNFTQYAYSYWRSNNTSDGRVGYLLLIGDVESLPIHVSENKSFDETIGTDNWYACVSGNDMMPDLMLGRLPAKNLGELGIMIDKIIQYEKNPLYGDWSNNALLMLGTVESLREDLEYARDNYLLPSGFNVSEVSALDGGDQYDVISRLNEGQYIVDYAGHGFVSNWEILNASDIQKLRNDRMLPAIFSLACSTGYFDNPDKDSLGEAFLKSRYGAIAFFGSSRLAAISSIGFGLSEAIAGHHVFRLGEITMRAKLNLLPYSTNLELYNLLGDPALDLSAPRRWAGIPDLIISSADISFKPESIRQGEQVTINVTVNNFGSSDATGVMLEVRDGGKKGTIIENIKIPVVRSGGNTFTQVQWTAPLGKPQHDIYVKAYLQGGISEHYMENNDANKQLLVSLESLDSPWQAGDRSLSAPVIADIDNDARMEILAQTANYDNQNKLYILRSDGQSVPGWHKSVYRSRYDYQSIYTNTSAGPAPSVGDLDGDGIPEIVAVFFSQEVYAWKNNGETLPGYPVKVNGLATTTPVLADIDSDGKMEVIFGTTDGNVHIRKYDGSSVPGWQVSINRRGHLFIAVSDIDNDFDMEIIAYLSPIPKTYNPNSSSYIYAWHHTGEIVDGYPVSMIGSETILPPVIGDLDGDGTGEIVAVSSNGETCRVYIWKNKSLMAQWQTKPDDTIESAIALGDIDQDGDAEIIATSDEYLYAWHHNGNPVFGFPVMLKNAYWFSAPVIADVDGNGELDIVFASQGSIIHAYKNDGKPLDGWPAIIDERASISPPAIVDLDNDGVTELVYTSSFGKIHKLALTGTASMEWSMLQHDAAHTGSYNAKTILPLPPSSPTAFDLPDDKGGSIVISWQPSPDDEEMNGYAIYRSDRSDGRYSMVDKVSSGILTYTDTTASVGVTYWYVIRTTNGVYLSIGTMPVSAYSFNNFAPLPPISMYANPGDMDGTIDLWWAKSDGNDIAGYKVYSGTTPGVYGKPLEAGNTNHYQFTGLINNKEYYISVSAYDMDGNESLPSKEIIAIPRDEDTEPPVFSSFYPSEVVEETDFYIKCTINDHSDIYDDNTGADGQGVYLAWDIDEISEKSYVMRMSQISPNTFVTDSRIPGQPLGTTIKYRVYAYDNDFDLGNIEDRTKGVSEEHTVGLIQSPSIAYNYPNPAPSGQYTDRTIFRYYTSSNAKITISIYSPAGFLVDRLDGQSQGEGYDEIEWNISSIASGVYIYTIEIQPISGNKQVIKKKLAIVK